MKSSQYTNGKFANEGLTDISLPTSTEDSGREIDTSNTIGNTHTEVKETTASALGMVFRGRHAPLVLLIAIISIGLIASVNIYFTKNAILEITKIIVDAVVAIWGVV